MIMEVMEVIKKLLLKYAPLIINQIHFLDQQPLANLGYCL